MRNRAGRHPSVLLAGMALVLGATWVQAAPLTETGRRAYETARNADDGAAAALEEGEKTVALIKALAPEREEASPALKPFLDEGEAAHQALGGYRRLAQASSTDALRLLADVTKLPVVPAPDLVRRDTLEQHALLAAHEAAVMAARTRSGGGAAPGDPGRGAAGHGRGRRRRARGAKRLGGPGWPGERGDHHAGQLAARRCRRAEPDRGAPGRGGARSRDGGPPTRAGRRTARRVHREAGARGRRRRAPAERGQRDALGDGGDDRAAPVTLPATGRTGRTR